MKLVDKLSVLTKKLFGKAKSKARWLVIFTGENRVIRRMRRRLSLRRIYQEFRGKGSGTRLAKTLEPKAVAQALKVEARREADRLRIQRAARKNGKTSIAQDVAHAILGGV